MNVLTVLSLTSLLGFQAELPKAEAKKVLDGYYKLIRGAKTIRAESTLEGASSDTTWLMKPRYYRVVQKAEGLESRTYVDGKFLYLVDPQKKSYDVFHLGNRALKANGLEAFIEGPRPAYTLSGKVYRGTYRGRAVYSFRFQEDKEFKTVDYLLVDQKTLIPVATQQEVDGELFFAKPFKVELNVPMNAKDFLWKPPKGYEVRIDMRKG